MVKDKDKRKKRDKIDNKKDWWGEGRRGKGRGDQRGRNQLAYFHSRR